MLSEYTASVVAAGAQQANREHTDDVWSDHGDASEGAAAAESEEAVAAAVKAARDLNHSADLAAMGMGQGKETQQAGVKYRFTISVVRVGTAGSRHAARRAICWELAAVPTSGSAHESIARRLDEPNDSGTVEVVEGTAEVVSPDDGSGAHLMLRLMGRALHDSYAVKTGATLLVDTDQYRQRYKPKESTLIGVNLGWTATWDNELER